MSEDLHVLILSDQPSDVERMLDELRRAGFVPTWERVEDERGYLQRLDSSLDVILADGRRVYPSPPRALALLRQAGLDVPFVVVMAAAAEESAVECLRQGATDYLSERHLGRLGVVVRRAVEQKRLREQKQQAEAALRASEAKFRCLLESAPDAIVVFDHGRRVVVVNSRAEQLFGYSRSELLGRPVEVLVPERFRGAFSRYVARQLGGDRGDPGIKSVRLRGRRKDGSEFPAEAALSVVEADGEILLTGIVRDITVRKQAEVTRAQLLRERVARAQAEAAVRARDEVLALVSHELKTPLTVIKGHTQLLQRQASQRCAIDHGWLLEALGRIDSASTRMVSLIDELLDVARLQMGEPLPLERSPTDLVRLARQSATRFQQMTDRHPIRVDAAVAELVGEWDAVRLERAIASVLRGAVERSRHGVEVLVRVAREDPWAVLQVIDRGLGPERRDAPEAARRFRREASIAAQRGAGAGWLGVRRIVEEHGGRVTVDGQEKLGTTVTLYLPLAPSTARERASVSE
ncbi:MAG TPA: PAS domain S-box protein, partial [Chloroflexota bacterium]